jgi:hypothetical protein
VRKQSPKKTFWQALSQTNKQHNNALPDADVDAKQSSKQAADSQAEQARGTSDSAPSNS